DECIAAPAAPALEHVAIGHAHFAGFARLAGVGLVDRADRQRVGLLLDLELLGRGQEGVERYARGRRHRIACGPVRRATTPAGRARMNATLVNGAAEHAAEDIAGVDA